MINETWPIFDDDDSGAISMKELSNVGSWFSISALQGSFWSRFEPLLKGFLSPKGLWKRREAAVPDHEVRHERGRRDRSRGPIQTGRF